MSDIRDRLLTEQNLDGWKWTRTQARTQSVKFSRIVLDKSLRL